MVLTGWYLWKRRRWYEGLSLALDATDDVLEGVVGLCGEEEEKMRRGGIGGRGSGFGEGIAG